MNIVQQLAQSLHTTYFGASMFLWAIPTLIIIIGISIDAEEKKGK